MKRLVNSLNKDNIKLDGLNRMVCEYARYRLRDADSRGDVSWICVLTVEKRPE